MIPPENPLVSKLQLKKAKKRAWSSFPLQMNLIGILRMLIFYWWLPGSPQPWPYIAGHIHRLAGGRHPINHEKLALRPKLSSGCFILKINVTIAGQMGNTRVGVFISCMASHYYWKDTDQRQSSGRGPPTRLWSCTTNGSLKGQFIKTMLLKTPSVQGALAAWQC